MKKLNTLILFGLLAIFADDSAYGQASTVARQADTLLAQLYRASGRNVDQLAHSTRQADIRMVQNALRNHGDQGRRAFENGGYAILRAGRQHGDEVVALAARNPDAARYVAANPQEALRIARQYGDDALRMEARLPGILTRHPGALNREQVGVLTRLSPDAQREVGVAMLRSNSPATTRRMVQATSDHGSSWVARIPMRYKIGGAVITGAILDRALFGKKGITGGIESATKSLAWSVAKVTGLIVGGLFALKFILLFTIRHLFTLPKRKKQPPPRQPESETVTPVETLEVVDHPK